MNLVNRRIGLVAAVLAGAAALGGCAGDRAGESAFDSPQRAVEQIRTMVRAEDWEQLAAYYDLAGSTVDRSDLESGAFFINPQGSAEPSPMSPPRIAHPFMPQYRFSRTIETQDPDEVIVEVVVEIDQGEGQPVQRGYDYFRMRRAADGWKILPQPVAPEDVTG